MKNLILSILSMVCYFSVDAQFNAQVTNATYDVSIGWGRKQSIIRNYLHGDIFCIANPTGDNTEYEILKFDGSNGNFITGIKILDVTGTFNAEFDPIAIIATDDNGVLVTGNYRGEVPDDYDALFPGGLLRTVFYAKFKADLSLSWLKLCYNSAILDSDPDDPNAYSDDIITNVGVVAVPTQGGDEEYILLNEGENNNFNFYFTLAKVDQTGALIDEETTPKHWDDAQASAISYLPLNNQIAVTGMGSAPNRMPFLFTITPNFTFPSSITEYFYGSFNHTDVGNVVESQNSPHHYFFTFSTQGDEISRSSPCHPVDDMEDVVNLLYLNKSTLAPISNWVYQADCQYQNTQDISIRNTEDGSGNPALLIGYTNREYQSSVSSTIITNSTYLHVDEAGGPLNMYKNNKFVETSNHFRSFIAADIPNAPTDDFFSLVYTNNDRIRILRTDYNGFVNSNCSVSVNIFDDTRDIQGTLYETAFFIPEYEAYEYTPPLGTVSLQTAVCQ